MSKENFRSGHFYLLGIAIGVQLHLFSIYFERHSSSQLVCVYDLKNVSGCSSLKKHFRSKYLYFRKYSDVLITKNQFEENKMIIIWSKIDWILIWNHYKEIKISCVCGIGNFRQTLWLNWDVSIFFERNENKIIRQSRQFMSEMIEKQMDAVWFYIQITVMHLLVFTVHEVIYEIHRHLPCKVDLNYRLDYSMSRSICHENLIVTIIFGIYF